MQVNHIKFGTGTVISQDAKIATVDFSGVIKKIYLYALTNEAGESLDKLPTYKPRKTSSQKRIEREAKLTAEERAEIKRINEDADYRRDWMEKREEEAKQGVLKYGKYE